MSKVSKTNIAKLNIHIAENGRGLEKKRICEVGGIAPSTLNKTLTGKNAPTYPVRYGIFKATGIKLCEEDDFSPLGEIAV